MVCPRLKKSSQGIGFGLERRQYFGSFFGSFLKILMMRSNLWLGWKEVNFCSGLTILHKLNDFGNLIKSMILAANSPRCWSKFMSVNLNSIIVLQLLKNDFTMFFFSDIGATKKFWLRFLLSRVKSCTNFSTFLILTCNFQRSLMMILSKKKIL